MVASENDRRFGAFPVVVKDAISHEPQAERIIFDALVRRGTGIRAEIEALKTLRKLPDFVPTSVGLDNYTRDFLKWADTKADSPESDSEVTVFDRTFATKAVRMVSRIHQNLPDDVPAQYRQIVTLALAGESVVEIAKECLVGEENVKAVLTETRIKFGAKYIPEGFIEAQGDGLRLAAEAGTLRTVEFFDGYYTSQDAVSEYMERKERDMKVLQREVIVGLRHYINKAIQNPKHREMVACAFDGMPYPAIADRFGVSLKTFVSKLAVCRKDMEMYLEEIFGLKRLSQFPRGRELHWSSTVGRLKCVKVLGMYYTLEKYAQEYFGTRKLMREELPEGFVLLSDYYNGPEYNTVKNNPPSARRLVRIKGRICVRKEDTDEIRREREEIRRRKKLQK